MSADVVLNVWAILAGAVVSMILGSLWYSKLMFGNVWMKLINKKQEDMVSPTGPMIGAVIVSLVNSFALALLLKWTGAFDLGDALSVAALLSVVVTAATAINYLFEGRKMQLLAIQVGYHIVLFVINSILFTVWQ